MIDVHNITNVSANLEEKIVDIKANIPDVSVVKFDKVEDVKVNGESVVIDRIAEIDLPIKQFDSDKIVDIYFNSVDSFQTYKMELIKAVRDLTGKGLKEAVDLVESVYNGNEELLVTNYSKEDFIANFQKRFTDNGGIIRFVNKSKNTGLYFSDDVNIISEDNKLIVNADKIKLPEIDKPHLGETYINGRLHTNGYTIDGICEDGGNSDIKNIDKIECLSIDANNIKSNNHLEVVDSTLLHGELAVENTANFQHDVNIKNSLDVTGTANFSNEIHGTSLKLTGDGKVDKSFEVAGTTRTLGNLITSKPLFPKETDKVDIGKETARYNKVYINKLIGSDKEVNVNDILTSYNDGIGNRIDLVDGNNKTLLASYGIAIGDYFNQEPCVMMNTNNIILFGDNMQMDAAMLHEYLTYSKENKDYTVESYMQPNSFYINYSDTKNKIYKTSSLSENGVTFTNDNKLKASYTEDKILINGDDGKAFINITKNSAKIVPQTFFSNGVFVSGEISATDSITVDGNEVALKKDVGDKFYFGKGDGEVTIKWHATIPSIKSYYEGLTIRYYVNQAGGTGTSLQINDLDEIPCYLNATTLLTTHYAVGSVITLTYIIENDVAKWKVTDRDTTYAAMLNQYWFDSGKLDSSSYNLTTACLFGRLENGNLCAISQTGTGTAKKASEGGFDLDHDSIYYSIVAATAGTTYKYPTGAYKATSIDGRYLVNKTSFTLNSKTYLVFTKGADGLFYLNQPTATTATTFGDNWWWNDNAEGFPTDAASIAKAEGLYFFELGMHYGGTSYRTVGFSSDHHIYYYDNGNIKIYK